MYSKPCMFRFCEIEPSHTVAALPVASVQVLYKLNRSHGFERSIKIPAQNIEIIYIKKNKFRFRDDNDNRGDPATSFNKVFSFVTKFKLFLSFHGLLCVFLELKKIRETTVLPWIAAKLFFYGMNQFSRGNSLNSMEWRIHSI